MKRVECSKQLVSMNSTEGVNFTSTQDLDLDLSFESRMALATMLGKQNPAIGILMKYFLTPKSLLVTVSLPAVS